MPVLRTLEIREIEHRLRTFCNSDDRRGRGRQQPLRRSDTSSADPFESSEVYYQAKISGEDVDVSGREDVDACATLHQDQSSSGRFFTFFLILTINISNGPR